MHCVWSLPNAHRPKPIQKKNCKSFVPDFPRLIYCSLGQTISPTSSYRSGRPVANGFSLENEGRARLVDVGEWCTYVAGRHGQFFRGENTGKRWVNHVRSGSHVFVEGRKRKLKRPSHDELESVLSPPQFSPRWISRKSGYPSMSSIAFATRNTILSNPADSASNTTALTYTQTRTAGFGPEVKKKRLLLGTYALTAESVHPSDHLALASPS